MYFNNKDEFNIKQTHISEKNIQRANSRESILNLAAKKSIDSQNL